MQCLSHNAVIVLDGSKDVPLYVSVYTACVVRLTARTVFEK